MSDQHTVSWLRREFPVGFLALCVILLGLACQKVEDKAKREESAQVERYSYPKSLLWTKARSTDVLREARVSGKLTAEEVELLRDCAVAQIMKDTGEIGAYIKLPDGRFAKDVTEPYGQMILEGRTLGEILDEARTRRSQWLSSQEEGRRRREELQTRAAGVLQIESAQVVSTGVMGGGGYPVAYGQIRNITADRNIEQLNLRLSYYKGAELVDVKFHDLVPGSSRDASPTGVLGPGQVREFHQMSLSDANRLVVEVESLVVR